MAADHSVDRLHSASERVLLREDLSDLAAEERNVLRFARASTWGGALALVGTGFFIQPWWHVIFAVPFWAAFLAGIWPKYRDAAARTARLRNTLHDVEQQASDRSSSNTQPEGA